MLSVVQHSEVLRKLSMQNSSRAVKLGNDLSISQRRAEYAASVTIQRAVRGWSTRKDLEVKGLAHAKERRKPSVKPDEMPNITPKEAALLQAAQVGDHAKVTELCHHMDLSSTVQDSHGRTPLMRAIHANQTITALLLLRYRGAKVAIRDMQGRSSLSYAIARNNLALTLALISNICGLAGNAADEVAAALSSQEVGRLYLWLSNIDPVQPRAETGAAPFIADSAPIAPTASLEARGGPR